MATREWSDDEVKGYELSDRLNKLEQRGYFIFSVIPASRGGFGSDYVRIVYYKQAK